MITLFRKDIEQDVKMIGAGKAFITKIPSTKKTQSAEILITQASVSGKARYEDEIEEKDGDVVDFPRIRRFKLDKFSDEFDGSE